MSLQGCLSGFAPWSPEDDARLALAYMAGGIKAAVAAFPERTATALYRRARRLGASRRRRWTAQDDRALANLWEDGYALKHIASALGRTQATTYWRAQTLGLPLGVPAGFESLTASCERTGYGSKQLRAVLGWAKVRIRRTISRPTRSRTGKRHHFVDPCDVDDAIAAWTKTETAQHAAERLGIAPDRLRARLRKVGVATSRTRHARVTEQDIEKANAIAQWSKRNRRAA